MGCSCGDIPSTHQTCGRPLLGSWGSMISSVSSSMKYLGTEGSGGGGDQSGGGGGLHVHVIELWNVRNVQPSYWAVPQ